MEMDKQKQVENKSQSNDINNNKEKVLDLGDIVKKLWKHKLLYVKVIPIVMCLSVLYIITIPRYYTTSASLAPEIESTSGGSLSSLASSFGIDLSTMESSDAITPLLYPDLMSDNKFVVDMFKIRVKAIKVPISTDYYTYIKKYTKHSLAENLTGSIRKLFTTKKKDNTFADKMASPYVLTKDDDDIAGTIRKNISIDVDKKTGVISISATSQDPFVSKILADSVTTRLQTFITKYRTSKAQLEADYYKKLMTESQKEYEDIRVKYAAYSDANTDVMLQSVKSKLEDMENDMQLKYNQYTTYSTQYQASVAKVLEHTPAFTVLKGAEVPVKPTGPKRMIFVLAMSFLAFVFVSLYAYFFKE